MTEPRLPSVPAGHEDPTRPAPDKQSQVVVVTYNHIAAAIVAIAEVVGRRVRVLDHRDSATDPATWLSEHPLGPDDALVLCDHDAPRTQELLRAALEGQGGYVAMMGSRRRAASVFAALRQEDVPDEAMRRLHVPAGLDLGGKAPGEIALSVVSEIVATSYGRHGGPMQRDTT